MNKKRTYSLTAKERKALRHGNKNIQEEKTEKVNTREAEEKAMAASQKRSRKTGLIIGISSAIAMVLVLVALIVPVIAYLVNPYRDYDYVIARFKLSNEMVLEYVIEEKEYDIAATNFIFLAKNGYFDNTVLFDAGDAEHYTDGWVRFGGYEQQPQTWTGNSSEYSSTHHHSFNATYCKNFSALPNSRFTNPTNKFGYSLNADENGQSERLNDRGVLAYIFDETSTEFQMSYKDQPYDQVETVTSGSVNMHTLKSTMVGFALNDKTVDNLKKIAATAEINYSTSSGVRWAPPRPEIRIESVKVYNLDSAKWRDFDFMSYMTSENRLRSWYGRA